MKYNHLKPGHSILVKASTPLTYNNRYPIGKPDREALLTNTRLDTYWIKLEQQGFKTIGFQFSEVTKDGKGASDAIILLTNDYNIKIKISYIEPLYSMKGKTNAVFSLCKGDKVLKTGSYIDDLRSELEKLKDSKQIEGATKGIWQ